MYPLTFSTIPFSEIGKAAYHSFCNKTSRILMVAFRAIAQFVSFISQQCAWGLRHFDIFMNRLINPIEIVLDYCLTNIFNFPPIERTIQKIFTLAHRIIEARQTKKDQQQEDKLSTLFTYCENLHLHHNIQEAIELMNNFNPDWNDQRLDQCSKLICDYLGSLDEDVCLSFRDKIKNGTLKFFYLELLINNSIKNKQFDRVFEMCDHARTCKELSSYSMLSLLTDSFALLNEQPENFDTLTITIINQLKPEDQIKICQNICQRISNRGFTVLHEKNALKATKTMRELNVDQNALTKLFYKSCESILRRLIQVRINYNSIILNDFKRSLKIWKVLFDEPLQQRLLVCAWFHLMMRHHSYINLFTIRGPIASSSYDPQKILELAYLLTEEMAETITDKDLINIVAQTTKLLIANPASNAFGLHVNNRMSTNAAWQGNHMKKGKDLWKHSLLPGPKPTVDFDTSDIRNDLLQILATTALSI